jgi:hypothetical protein
MSSDDASFFQWLREMALEDASQLVDETMVKSTASPPVSTSILY